MKNTVGIMLGCLLFASAAHSAELWQPKARECAAEIEQQAGCTSACTNKIWPEVVRCTNFRLRRPLPQEAIERCISQTQRQRSAKTCELCSDPAVEVFACAGG